MRRLIPCVLLCGLPLVVTGCAGAGLSNESALGAEKIELQVTDRGGISEVEYHIRPSEVPAAVRAAMKKRHPDAQVFAAEKEWNGGKLYYELAAKVGGFTVEAMFTPAGELHEIEAEVAATSVPAAVRNGLRKAYPGGSVTAWEAIRNGAGDVLQYHCKLTRERQNLKVILNLDGAVERTYREIPAEIEVPMQ